MTTRQVTGMEASLLALAGLDWPVPDSSTLCRRQKGMAVGIPHRPGTGVLPLLIDIEPVSATGSSEPTRGIKAEGDGAWCARKHGPSKPRQWRKVHLGIDAEKLEIRAIEVTGAGVGDVEPVSATGSSEPARHAARVAGPDPRRPAHHQGQCGRCIGHPGLPRGHRRTRCHRGHPDPLQWPILDRGDTRRRRPQ